MKQSIAIERAQLLIFLTNRSILAILSTWQRLRKVSTVDQCKSKTVTPLVPEARTVEPPKLIPEILALKGFALQEKRIAHMDQMLNVRNGWFPVKKHLLRFHKTCCDTLERLHLESRKTLNLLSLVIAHPFSVERRTALKLQRDQEKEAQSANERCKHNLFRWLGRF
jgi:hypothetical protein